MKGLHLHRSKPPPRRWEDRSAPLDCLWEIAELSQRGDLPLEEFYRLAVGLVAGARIGSGRVSARLCLDTGDFRSPDFQETGWRWVAPVTAGGAAMGALEVFTEGPSRHPDFEPDETRLVEAVARLLGKSAETARAHLAVAEREANLRRVLESEGDGVLVVDPSGSVLYANGAAAHLLGRPLDSLRGQQVGLPVITGDWAEVRIARPGGGVAAVELRSVESDWFGQPCYVVSLHDISERRQLEQERLGHAENMNRVLFGAVQALAHAIEIRDPFTGGHQQRVADLAVAIGTEMGLDANALEGLRLGASIHDVGKILVPSETLIRPAPLTPVEMDLVRTHPASGWAILKDMAFPWPVAEMVLQHHERLDGSGYPLGLKGDAICRDARILAVADVVEAMASHRPQRPALGLEDALAEIAAGRGTLFDADAVDACSRLFAHGYALPPVESLEEAD